MVLTLGDDCFSQLQATITHLEGMREKYVNNNNHELIAQDIAMSKKVYSDCRGNDYSFLRRA